MKKRFVSMVLACTLCMLMCATPFASAAQVNNDLTYTESETIDVVDTNGNVLGSVKAPRALILAGAAIFIGKLKVMVYTGSMWVALHPKEVEFFMEYRADFLLYFGIYCQTKYAIFVCPLISVHLSNLLSAEYISTVFFC